MPAFTPNRNYPYSIPGDPADVAGAIQALAEAVDADLQTLQAAIGPRPMARLRGTANATVQASTSEVIFTWDTVDFNNGAIDASTLGNNVIRPTTQGLWFLMATVVAPPAPGLNLDTYGIAIRDENLAVEVSETRLHTFPYTTETGGRTIPCSGVALYGPSVFTPPGFQVVGLLERASGSSPYTYREQSITLIRMVEF